MRKCEKRPRPEGRPPKYSDPEVFGKRVDAYFDKCDKREIDIFKDGMKLKINDPAPYTVAGLALFLGFEDRHSLLDYADKNKHENEEKRALFSSIIKKARTRIEGDLSTRCVESGKPTGCIFLLKNIFGYSDKQEIALSKIKSDSTQDLDNVPISQLKAVMSAIKENIPNEPKSTGETNA